MDEKGDNYGCANGKKDKKRYTERTLEKSGKGKKKGN